MPTVKIGRIVAATHYTVSTHARKRSKRGSLMDRGANGGIVGNDARVYLQHTREVDVTGIDNHELNSLKIVDASAVAMSQMGPVIVLLQQYAYHGVGRTIHSAGQLEHYKNMVNDRSMVVGGSQCIRTHDGYVLPLDIINGLPYLKMHPNTDDEFQSLPHVILTSGSDWDPSVIDKTISDQDDWYNMVKEVHDGLIKTPFDEYGRYRHREPLTISVDNDDQGNDEDILVDHEGTPPPIEAQVAETDLRQCFHMASNLNLIYVDTHESDTNDPVMNTTTDRVEDSSGFTANVEKATAKEVKPVPIDYETYRPYFLHVPVEKVRKTFQNSTRFASNIMSGHNILQTIQSPYPANNVWRRNEPVATDTIYAEVPAVDSGGQKMAQLFIGRKSLVIDVYGMGNEAEFVNTLEDNIRKRGAMDKLISDSARVEVSQRVQDILRALCIDDWQSEPNYQHQNFAERRWKHLKRNVHWYMNVRNVDPSLWLLCTQWCADVMNHTAEKSLNWRIPLSVITGQTTDISILLTFLFNDIVYCSRYEDSSYKGQIGSTKSSEIRGRFVGFAWHVGHALTFKVLTDDTRKVICRSRLRLAKDGENNLKLDMEAGAVPQRVYIQSKRDSDGDDLQLPTIDMASNPFHVDYGHDTASTPIPNDDQLSHDRTPLPPSEGEPLLGEPTPGETLFSPPTAPSPPSTLGLQQGESSSRDTAPTVALRRSRRLRGESASVESLTAQLRTKNRPFTNGTEDDLDAHTPMDDVPLSQQPEVKLSDQNEDLAPHCRDTERGESSVNEPFDFSTNVLRTENTTIPNLPPEEMIDRTFLMPPEEDGSRFRAKVVARVQESKAMAANHPEMIKFRCLVNRNDETYEEVVAYNDIVEFIEQDDSWDGLWKFKRILQHKGPLTPPRKGKKPDLGANDRGEEYMGAKYNVQVEWETGEVSWRPLSTHDKQGVFDTDPVTVAIYAEEHGLLDTSGWGLPGLKKLAKTQKRLIRQANQAKLHSFRTKPMYMYGFQVPRNHEQAMQLDQENGNTRWREAELIEMGQIHEYEALLDKGKGYTPGPGYKKIRCHLVYAVKHDGRHKARLVAGGHLTDTPIDSVYSSVVSLRGIRILTFLAEHNELETWCTDIGNAYLESYTKEKVYIIAGPEFGELEGHTLIIQKALYGLKSSGLRWHERFVDVLRDMGFVPSKAEPDIWMRDKDDHYEYIGVYVDDLLICSKHPQNIIDELSGPKHQFKLKGTGPITFHLGCDFFRDKEGVLCYAPRKYIEKILDNYRRLFGVLPRQVTSPLTKGDHPELDTSELLDMEGIQIYQSLVGALQWVIQIGRFDVQTAVMTLSRFRAAPRKGHLDRIKRIHGYLSKMRHAVIRIRTEMPDYSDIPTKEYDWKYTCYRGATEEIPHDTPRPLGKPVQTTHYFDANLYHDLISGRSVTGILHLFNKTPIDWYSKLQSTVETATFGSEYVAGRTCTEQVIDLRLTLRYLGVPIAGSSMVFGDNESMINTASVPYGKLHKRHNALSYHRTREAVAAGITRLHHIGSKMNPADILSKHWDYPSVWGCLRPLLFWEGDTATLDDKKVKQSP